MSYTREPPLTSPYIAVYPSRSIEGRPYVYSSYIPPVPLQLYDYNRDDWKKQVYVEQIRAEMASRLSK
jgi:hypothetical protein